MNISDLLKTSDAISVRRVFGEPYEKDGLTIVPVAVVAGGGGGGEGHDEEKHQGGEGGGFGMAGRPAGAYVIRGSEVKWEPAVDVNRIVTMLGIVAVAYLLTRPSWARARAKAARRHR
jgi:uncharacterized spore protein YtfJ